jgi:hypothetical protein
VSTATATGLGVGSHTVTITDGVGSTSVQTVVLTAPSALLATATSVPTCTGESNGSIDLTVTGGNDCQGYTFAWNNGANTATVSGLGSGTYTVTVTDAAGCSQTLAHTVAALALPQPAFTQSGNLLTSTQTWTSYQWLLNGSNIPGANANTYSITQTGTYALSVTDSNGCVGVSDTSTVVGVDGNIGEWAISIYPNPARGEFRLRTAQPLTEVLTLRIHDMFGRLIFESELPGLETETAFDISELPASTYSVEVTTAGMNLRKVFRLVVQ